MPHPSSPLAQYRQALDQGFVADPAQLEATEQLERCFQALAENRQPLGVYLWGPVGRGKTWLMDAFYSALDSLSVPAKRQHFHHFLAWLHKKLFQLTGTENPLQAVANELAQEIKVLCFDELFVNDIGDAMLLGPLFQALFDAGVVLVATSNQAPQDLYDEGFNRERFFPAIDALIAYCHVVHLDGQQDHRLHGRKTIDSYLVKSDTSQAQLKQLFSKLSGQEPSNGLISLGSRELPVLGAHQQTLWCEFSALCENKLAASDYMLLCQNYRHILVSDIPNLSANQEEARIARGTEDAPVRVQAGDRILPNLAKNDDAVRRFIALVDECYDQQVMLYLEAAVPLAELYTSGFLTFAFRRTLSRIEEMQRKPLAQSLSLH
ncbi:MAG: cell division protein ZapE [Venatoribacter sp.]